MSQRSWSRTHPFGSRWVRVTMAAGPGCSVRAELRLWDSPAHAGQAIRAWTRGSGWQSGDLALQPGDGGGEGVQQPTAVLD